MKRKKSDSWPGQARGQDAPFLSHSPGPEQNGGDPEEMCTSDRLSCHLCTWHGGGLSWMLNGCWRVRVQAPTPCVSPATSPVLQPLERHLWSRARWPRALGSGRRHSGPREPEEAKNRGQKRTNLTEQEPAPPPQPMTPTSTGTLLFLSAPPALLPHPASPRHPKPRGLSPPTRLPLSVTNVRLLCAHSSPVSPHGSDDFLPSLS